MELIQTQIQCPYCWEILEITIDPSVDEQSYVEDCHVCCAPIVLDVLLEEGDLQQVNVRRENE